MRTIGQAEMRRILENLRNQSLHVEHIEEDAMESRCNSSIHYFEKAFELVDAGDDFLLDFKVYGQVRYVHNYIDGMFEASLLDDYKVSGVSDLTLWNDEEQVELTEVQRGMIEKTIKENVTV